MNKKTIQTIQNQKNQKKITCLTAYTSSIARIVDNYVDITLIGDSLGSTIYGMKNTQHVTLEMMKEHGRAVAKNCKKSFTIVDMPYNTYNSNKKALLNIESMSTYAMGHLINQVCKNLSSNQLYLNIGCWKGFSLIAGMIDTSCEVIGVDDFSQFGGPREEFFNNFNKFRKGNIHKFYEDDYKVFFKNF